MPRAVLYWIIFFLAIPSALANQTLEEIYGHLPQVRAISISPDGKHYAYIQRADNKDFFIIYRSDTDKLVASFKADKFKARPPILLPTIMWC